MIHVLSLQWSCDYAYDLVMIHVLLLQWSCDYAYVLVMIHVLLLLFCFVFSQPPFMFTLFCYAVFLMSYSKDSITIIMSGLVTREKGWWYSIILWRLVIWRRPMEHMPRQSLQWFKFYLYQTCVVYETLGYTNLVMTEFCSDKVSVHGMEFHVCLSLCT